MSHAVLSASSASRWLRCPPSARFELQFPAETSPYAEEGTRAHAHAEQWLRHLLYEMDPSPSIDDAEMADAVDQYVTHVIARTARRRDVYIEQRVDLTPWVPEGYGTSDAIIVAGDAIEVVDLKYGKGVPVSAEANPQTRLYALGALHTVGFLYEIQRVRTTIVQPRLDSVSSEELTVEELLAWGEEVKPVAQTAFAGEGAFAPGAWCRFCRARAVCRARAEANLDLARHEFQPPASLDIEEIAGILRQVDDLKHWASDVEGYALAQAIAGTEIPGWKVVEGRSVRTYTDEDAVVAALAEREDFDTLAPRKPLGITAMEKALGKGVFATVLGPHVTKPPGKPALVPDSDKRQPLDTVKSDFREE